MIGVFFLAVQAFDDFISEFVIDVFKGQEFKFQSQLLLGLLIQTIGGIYTGNLPFPLPHKILTLVKELLILMFFCNLQFFESHHLHYFFFFFIVEIACLVIILYLLCLTGFAFSLGIGRFGSFFIGRSAGSGLGFCIAGFVCAALPYPKNSPH